MPPFFTFLLSLGSVAMTDWADKKAEGIVDAFVADTGPEDLLRLQQAIAKALRQAYAGGRNRHPDPTPSPRH